MPRKPMPDVLVLLPGILGSVLQKDGNDVWALSAGAVFRGLISLGDSVRDLRLGEDDPAVDDLGDGIAASRLMPDLHIIPGFWSIDGYGAVAQYVQEQFEITPGENYFELPYDWRRDNRVAARRLAREAPEWLRSWRERSGNDEAQLILLAHSMGGLVARYYLEIEGGWQDTRALITFGTPYSGSLNALGFLANGFRKKVGPLTLIDLSDLLRSLTSVYQLAPIYRCVDHGDGTLVKPTDSPIPNIDAARLGSAAGFHNEIREAVEVNRQDDAFQHHGYTVRPVVGIDQPTLQSALVNQNGADLVRTLEGKDMGGDGTVPRISATPAEMEDRARAMHSSQVHASLQNAAEVLTHLKGVLSADEADIGRFLAPAPFAPHLGLDSDGVFAADEPVAARVHCLDPSLQLEGVVANADTGNEVSRFKLEADDDVWRDFELAPHPPGIYRIRISGSTITETISDIFAVF